MPAKYTWPTFPESDSKNFGMTVRGNLETFRSNFSQLDADIQDKYPAITEADVLTWMLIMGD